MYAWSHKDSVELTCLKKWQETPDTVSLELGCRDNEMIFDFKPGQFITLGLTMPSKRDYRAYSVSSMPGGDSLKLTVKRVEGGLVSNYIVDHLDEGDEVDVLKPAGRFNSIDCPPIASNKVTLISAGCGITPVMAMAKHWLSTNNDVEIDFIHMAKNKEQTIYYYELLELSEKHDNFNLKLLLKDNSETGFPQGRLDKEWLLKLSPDIKEGSVYLCGPVGFMEDVEGYLKQIEFDMSAFFQESFTPDFDSPTPLDAAIESAQPTTDSETVKVMVPSFGVEMEVDKASALIDALEKGGVPVIAACRSGICGSCKCKVTKGSVKTSSSETLTDEDIEQGFVLACSSQVEGDVEIALN
ncbi:hybrid-cluster NAD(P)-dependent oxidoreductase [uncultured Vibrio sp.]|uniref:hybrid-cluster NAD(P)-dependent oxidoreductase n=1 Tax=uncultured Vibrio sp. TaxID=114054 RepID=UPI0025F68D37|nr:hybrid-cluster NAD(P)-dependent oxidoreductase [uncultured Vibrio sp.]